MAWFQSATLWISELADRIAVINLDVPGTSRNPLTAAVFDDLGLALDALQKESRFRVLLIRSVKPGHFASGPSAAELAALKTEDDFAMFTKRGQDVLQRLASLPIPSVAVIAGMCLGGGLELALACDYRVVIDEGGTRLGCNDDAGVLPCWGGTQRLPRVIGLERSFLMLLSGGSIGPSMALAWGLADALAQHSDDPPTFLDHAVKQSRPSLPLHTWRQFFLEGLPPGRWLLFRGFERVLKRVVPDDLPAPLEILPALRLGVKRDLAAGLAFERDAFVRLGQSDACRNLLHLRLQREPQPTPPLEGFRVAIVGSGKHSLWLLYLAATHGDHVVVRNANETELGLMLFQVHAFFKRNVREEAARRMLEHITGTTGWKGFAEVDLVFVTDDDADVFHDVETQTRPDTLLVTAGDMPRVDLQHPERIAALNLVVAEENDLIVEIAADSLKPGLATKLSAWIAHKKGVAIAVRDRPGFVVQRVWLAGIHEAVLLLQEGHAIGRIDAAMHRFGVKPGPFEMADQLGLPRIARLAAQLDCYPDLGVFLADLVSRNWHGRQSGTGFYVHKERRVTPNSRIPVPPRFGQLSLDDERAYLCERLVARFINEAARCWEEGIAQGPDQIDLALASSGWAPHRGGPLTYARQQGADDIIAWLQELAARHDARFAPCPALGRLSALSSARVSSIG